VTDEPRPLVLVAVGTDHHPFDRVVRWIDGWLADGGDARADVLVQHGSAAAPTRADGVAALDHEGLQDAMSRAAVVITHGGPATIREARAHGRLPICVPRDPALGEHVDNHQQLFAGRMGAAGVVRLATTEPELRAALEEALAHPERFTVTRAQLGPPAGLERFADLVADVLPVDPGQQVPVLYMGGLGRSGSTLLERALGQVEGICAVGEIVHLWERGLRDDELCGCGARFSQCPFWQRVGKSAYGGWDRLDIDDVLRLKASVDRRRHAARLVRPTPGSAFTRRVRAYGSLLTRLYAAVLEVSGADVVVDSSKHASTALVLAATPGVDLRVLHVVRDAPAVAYAWTKQVERPEAGPDAYMPTWRPWQTAAHWASENALVDLGARHGTPTRLVRYEDFVRDPRGSLEGALDFAGVRSPDGADLLPFLDGQLLDLEASHTVAGNPMRFESGTVRIVADEAWRFGLPPATRRLVGAATAPLRSRYAYLGRRARETRTP
jgi:UDP-N-acetylglucosamine transferase subunit ALG13